MAGKKGNLDWQGHVAGVVLVCLALGLLVLLPQLPSRSSAALGLPALDRFDGDVVMAFAGYPGCSTVCPTALAQMASAHIAAGLPNVDLAFINIDRYAKQAQSDAFAQAFHPEFRSITVEDTSAVALLTKLGITTFDQTSSQPPHAGRVFVLTRAASDWRIAQVYQRLPDNDSMVRDLKRHAGASTPVEQAL